MLKKRARQKGESSPGDENPYKSVISWFDKGHHLNILFGTKDREKINQLYQVDGLHALVKKAFPHANEREAGNDRYESFLSPRSQIASGNQPFESGERPRFGRLRHHAGAPPSLKKAATLSRGIFCRSPVPRRFTSATPSLNPLGPTITCQGRPIRSITVNLAPGRSSVSS